MQLKARLRIGCTHSHYARPYSIGPIGAPHLLVYYIGLYFLEIYLDVFPMLNVTKAQLQKLVSQKPTVITRIPGALLNAL